MSSLQVSASPSYKVTSHIGSRLTQGSPFNLMFISKEPICKFGHGHRYVSNTYVFKTCVFRTLKALTGTTKRWVRVCNSCTGKTGRPCLGITAVTIVTRTVGVSGPLSLCVVYPLDVRKTVGYSMHSKQTKKKLLSELMGFIGRQWNMRSRRWFSVQEALDDTNKETQASFLTPSITCQKIVQENAYSTYWHVDSALTHKILKWRNNNEIATLTEVKSVRYPPLLDIHPREEWFPFLTLCDFSL